jgi:hypothetical protein
LFLFCCETNFCWALHWSLYASFIHAVKTWSVYSVLLYKFPQESVENNHLWKIVSPRSGNWCGFWQIESYMQMSPNKSHQPIIPCCYHSEKGVKFYSSSKNHVFFSNSLLVKL